MPAVDLVSAAPAGRGSMSQLATGAFVASGNAVSLMVGFNPRKVTIINETKGTTLVKLQGNSPNACMKSGALDSTGLVLFPADAGLNEPGSAVLLAATNFSAGDKVAFAVEG
jgi:hypothetical protein